ncbi:17845_t:CDS:1, partial [Gigaspora margarita]
FMKINVKKAGDIVKYFKKWQSDLEQFNKAFNSFDYKNRSTIESSIERK